MMSKAARAKLVALDIVTVVIDNITESLTHTEHPGEVSGLLVQLTEARDACFKLIAPTGRLELEPGDHTKYKTAVEDAHAIIKTTWPKTCPAEALITVAVDQIERVRDHMKKNRQWNHLIDIQWAIYLAYDPELVCDHCNEGETVSTAILNRLRCL